ncbi:GAG-pre-integrase domain [Popillia japonica]|uniref:GAG-pre-integrase domain n=1 Tax=Popillia japonica TaxID=7064 RepID=A0AAW1KF33_POPJA
MVVIFQNKEVSIYKDEQVVAKGMRNGKLYELSLSLNNVKKEEQVVAKGMRNGKLYELSLSLNNVKKEHAHIVEENKVELWHKRLGHLGMHGMMKLASTEEVEGLDISPSTIKRDFNQHCEVCSAGIVEEKKSSCGIKD